MLTNREREEECEQARLSGRREVLREVAKLREWLAQRYVLSGDGPENSELGVIIGELDRRWPQALDAGKETEGT